MLTRFQHIPLPERRAAMISIVTGLSLLAIKFVAYWLTGSSAIFSDAVESIVNVLASMVALWALVVAHTPADTEHPYGHGKAEFMSAGLEGGMILLAAVFIFVSTLDTVLRDQVRPQALDLGLLLMALAMLVNGVVGAMLIRTGRTQNSIALVASGAHLLSDAVTSVAVLIGLGLTKLTVWADPIAAIIIAIYIAGAGIKLLSQSFAGLMDKQDPSDMRKLTQILDAHVSGADPAICSYHKLRHRHSGRYHWVDFHVVVPAHLDVAEGHRIASKIEYEMEQSLGEGNATAHIEPCIDAGCAKCK